MEAQRAAAVAAPKLWDVVTAKPSFAGFSIDLVTAEAWLKAWRRK
jgi:hypothetical protein